jgi:hypothetical protein
MAQSAFAAHSNPLIALLQYPKIKIRKYALTKALFTDKMGVILAGVTQW